MGVQSVVRGGAGREKEQGGERRNVAVSSKEEGGGRCFTAPCWGSSLQGWNSTQNNPCATVVLACPKRGKPGPVSVCGQEAKGGGKVVPCKKMAVVAEGGQWSLLAAFLVNWL